MYWYFNADEDEDAVDVEEKEDGEEDMSILFLLPLERPKVDENFV